MQTVVIWIGYVTLFLGGTLLLLAVCLSLALWCWCKGATWKRYLRHYDDLKKWERFWNKHHSERENQ
jgi:hypothetical protein